MSAFIAAYHNETSKLVGRKKYIVFLIIGLLICLAWAVGGSLLTGAINQHAGIFFVLTPTPMGVLPFFLQLLLPLLIFMGATDLITVEGAEHTMKAMIYRPVMRWKLYFAKIAAIMTYVALYLVCVFALSGVLNQLLGRALNFSGFVNAFAAYALTLPTLFVLASFAALVALLGRSGSLVMLLLVGIYFVMSILPVFFPILSELLFTSFLGWHRLWIGVRPNASRLIHMLVIVAGYGIVFFVAGSLVFDRKEY